MMAGDPRPADGARCSSPWSRPSARRWPSAGSSSRAWSGATTPAAAIVMSALLFGFMHVLLSLFQQLFNATLLGLVLGLLAVRSRSLLPGIVFHVLNNGLAVALGSWVGDRVGRAIRRPGSTATRAGALSLRGRRGRPSWSRLSCWTRLVRDGRARPTRGSPPTRSSPDRGPRRVGRRRRTGSARSTASGPAPTR